MRHPWEQDGGRAFPSNDGGTSLGGISLRQWYAGQALPGAIQIMTKANDAGIGNDLDEKQISKVIAALALQIADALIEVERTGEGL